MIWGKGRTERIEGSEVGMYVYVCQTGSLIGL